MDHSVDGRQRQVATIDGVSSSAVDKNRRRSDQLLQGECHPHSSSYHHHQVQQQQQPYNNNNNNHNRSPWIFQRMQQRQEVCNNNSCDMTPDDDHNASSSSSSCSIDNNNDHDDRINNNNNHDNNIHLHHQHRKQLTTTNNADNNNRMDEENIVSSSSSDDDDTKSPNNTHCCGPVRQTCGIIANNPTVQMFIVGLIMFNALMLGVGTSDMVTESPTVSSIFELTDKIILIIFTIEFTLQMIHHGLYHVLFNDGWLCFDLIIVVMSWSLESISIVRALRVFRVVRLIGRLDTLRKLVQALIDVAPSVSAIISLLLLVMYVYAVLCTTLFGDLYERGYTDTDYFGRLDRTLFTLFQFVTFDWAQIVRQVTAVYYWSWAIFSSFLVITSIILYSLIVAVVCDAVSKSEHADDADNNNKIKSDAKDETAATMEQLTQLQKRVAQLTHQQDELTAILQHCLDTLVTTTTMDTTTYHGCPGLVREDSTALSDSIRSSSQSSVSSANNSNYIDQQWMGTIAASMSNRQSLHVNIRGPKRDS